jgi:hypothetical protein
MLSHGHMDPGMHVLTKPFAVAARVAPDSALPHLLAQTIED